jgi:uncharacterized membrane protein YeaQ/YmgE (transglycosylase-associated protein family)
MIGGQPPPSSTAAAPQGILVRIVLNIVGLILALFGIVWILQGLGILPGSFMTGHIRWAVVGAVVLVVAIAILVSANRRK